MKSYFVAFVLCCLPITGSAAIYQCQDQDGRTTFSDQPCAQGVNKELPEYETILEPFVSGRYTAGQTSFPARNGVVTWDKDTLELTLVLTKNPLSDTEIQQAVLKDWSFLEGHKTTGLAKISLVFKSKKINLKQLRTMQSEVFGLSSDDEAIASILGGGDVEGHINRMEISKKDRTRWLAFSSQELTPELRWNINLVLPISD